MKASEQLVDRTVDAVSTVAVGTVILGLGLGEWEAIVNIAAGGAAFFAATAAGIYHITKWKRERREKDTE